MTDSGITNNRIHREDRDAVAVLTLDYPGRSMNVVDESVFNELAQHVTDVAADPSITAAVIASGKPTSFGAGADVEWLPELVSRSDASEFLESVHQLMYRIVESSKPYVAAVNGPALGGALELILSTHAIVATRASQLGLPEITLGLMPGGAGTQLLQRFLTTDAALELLLSGRALDADTARDRGLIAAIPDNETLIASAVTLALDLAADPSLRPGTSEPSDSALATVAERAIDAKGPAAAILEAVRVGIAEGPVAGCAAEREHFVRLVKSAEAKARIHLFQSENNIKRLSRGTASAPTRIGVVGGGQMGSGIAATAASRGLAAVVRDLSDDQLRNSRKYLDKVLSRSAPELQDQLATNWAATTEWEGFDSADAVIEAVFELPEIKTETLRAISGVVGDNTLIATNTSAIPIRTLAPAVTRPERFVGMHFFSPVERMPLVEIVPHSGTSAETVASAAALTRSLGKLPVVVADAPGFFTSRVYARWLMEGIRLLLDGVEPQVIEDAAKAAGFPIGPLQAHDEATLDLVVKASITQVAEPVMSDRIDVAAVRSALESLIAAGVTGRRHGVGFYLYEDGKRLGMNPAVASTLAVHSTGIAKETVADRLLLAFATECWLCWDDGTICHPDDGDVASVLGIGFPRALGGPFHWADERGLTSLVARCTELGVDAFPVGTRMPQLAASGASFAAEQRLAAPAS